MPPAHPHDAFGQSLLEDVAWTSGFLRGTLDRDIVALLPDGPFAVFESGFVDSELRITRADGVFSIRLTDGRTLYTIIGLNRPLHPMATVDHKLSSSSTRSIR